MIPKAKSDHEGGEQEGNRKKPKKASRKVRFILFHFCRLTHAEYREE